MVYQQATTPTGALDAVFTALAHPARRDIVRYLAHQEQAPTMTAVATASGVSPQMLNKHALILERAGIAHRSSAGRERRLVLNAHSLDDVQAWIEDTRSFWERAFTNLEAYAASLSPRSTS